MRGDHSFRTNSPTIISAVIDDEAVIMNLESGAYYSLRDCGSVIWQLVERGLTVSQVVDYMGRRYEGEANSEEIGRAVQRLIAELVSEALIVARDEGESAPELPQAVGAAQEPFQEPQLEKFTDMADLLLLDPIHEVDEMGWPRPRTN